MKALLLLGLWIGAGMWFARLRTDPVERVMATLFWPFYVGAPNALERPDHLTRLAAALGPGLATDGLLSEVDAALRRVIARRQRVTAALEALGPIDGADEVRQASRRLLEEAQARIDAQLAAAHAAIADTATRLVLARDGDDPAELESLMSALRARLLASEEVHRSAP